MNGSCIIDHTLGPKHSFIFLPPSGGKRETKPWGNLFASCLVSSSSSFVSSAHFLPQPRHIERMSREFRPISTPRDIIATLHVNNYHSPKIIHHSAQAMQHGYLDSLVRRLTAPIVE